MTCDSVSLIIVTFNSARHLTPLFDSLELALEGIQHVDVVVADNASNDGTPDLVRSLQPDARLVPLGENLGYAAGVNAGIAHASSETDAFLILNPDIELRPRAVKHLCNAAREGVGIVVPRLLEPDGSLQHSLRRTPSITRAFGESLLGGRLAGRFELFGEVVRNPNRYEDPHDVDWASGAAMLVTRDCAERAGEWDESYFLYSEEVDFALRAGAAGFRIRYEPAAIGVHVGGDAHVNPDLWALLTVNRVRAFRRRRGLAAGGLFWLALVLGEALRSFGSAPHRVALRALFRGVELPRGTRRRHPLST